MFVVGVIVHQATCFIYLSGAADNLVKLWKGNKARRTFTGHTQAVRALAKLDSSVGSGDLFASAGNDA